MLNSWKEISSYVGRGVRTVQRWERDFGLPVRRPAGHLKSSVIALRSDIDRWLLDRKTRELDSVSSFRCKLDSAEVRRLAASVAQLQDNLQALQKEHARLAMAFQRLRNATEEPRMKSASNVA